MPRILKRYRAKLYRRIWFTVGCIYMLIQILVIIIGKPSYKSFLFNDLFYIQPINGSLLARRLNINKQPMTGRTEQPFLDMVNDYRPFIDFKFVFPEILPVINDSRDIFLIVLVNSAAKGNEYRKKRDQIRQTWGNRETCEQLRAMADPKIRQLKWIQVFVVGKVGPGTSDDQLNAEEAKQYNDMVIGNIDDNYLNNIIKFYMGLVWISTRFNANYILKTDDDVYVRIPGVVQYLAGKNFPSQFYGGVIQRGRGLVVSRIPGGKWSVSKKYFDEDLWPPFNYGAFILLSTDLMNSLFNYVHTRKPFHIDDAYIGVAMRDFKVNATDISSFVVKKQMPRLLEKKTNCQILDIIAFGHSLNSELLNVLHERYQAMCRKMTNVVNEHDKALQCN